MPYIQRGGGLFSAVGDLAKRFALPWFVRAVKTAQSGATEAIKSEATKNIVKHAKKAVQDGIVNASNQVLQGENVGKALVDSSNKAKDKIVKAVQAEVAGKGKKRKAINSTKNINKKYSLRKRSKAKPEPVRKPLL